MKVNFNRPSTSAQGSFIDAQEIHNRWWDTYTPAQQNLAHLLVNLLGTAFSYEKTYITARPTMLSVKISNAEVIDRVKAFDLCTYLDSLNLETVFTKQGMIVRIRREYDGQTQLEA